jgi:hypothetical protein
MERSSIPTLVSCDADFTLVSCDADFSSVSCDEVASRHHVMTSRSFMSDMELPAP